MKVWLQSYTPRPCRHLVTASLCFRGLFFWDELYTRNRDSERSMINATIRERRLQTRFDYGYWNVILLLGKVINAPIDMISEICGCLSMERDKSISLKELVIITISLFFLISPLIKHCKNAQTLKTDSTVQGYFPALFLHESRCQIALVQDSRRQKPSCVACYDTIYLSALTTEKLPFKGRG